MATMATNSALLSTTLQPEHRISRFQLHLVSRTTAAVNLRDVCKQTCKLPEPPNTCKLECHSGAPFMDMREDAPDAVC
jgi:hypothetical protein